MSNFLARNVSPFSDEEYENIVQTLADTTSENARGSTTDTTYMLEPKIWLTELLQAAKKDFRYADVGWVGDIKEGRKTVIAPKQNIYKQSWSASVTPGTAVNYTTLDNYDGVEIAATHANYAVAITYDTIRQNVVDYLGQAREELGYHAGDEVDQSIVTTISGATLSTSSAAGASSIFGGDATQASELSDGDIITTDMIAEGGKKLKSELVYYWTGGTGESKVAKATATKNPWKVKDDFVAIISPEQEEAFLTDSQFINASEYGSPDVLLNGEIGRIKYLGTKILVSNNAKQVASGAVGTTDGSTAGADINTCYMTKMKKGHGLAYQVRPKLHIVDFPSELETRLILEQSFGSKVLFDDAIVHINVSQI